MTQQQRKSHHNKLRKERLIAARSKGTHTPEQWLQLRDEFGFHCVRCLSIPPSLQKDHITPLYQGGSDGIENIQPLCPSCNSSKGPDTFNWVSFRRSQQEEATNA